MYSINWPGPHHGHGIGENLLDDKFVIVTTQEKEKYRCILPDALDASNQVHILSASSSLFTDNS